MSTSQELDAKVAELEQQLDEARKAAAAQRAEERNGIIAQLNELIAGNGIAADELSFPRASKGNKSISSKSKKGTPGKPKYRHPDSGATWTGKGKPPTWIQNVPDRDVFLIKGE